MSWLKNVVVLTGAVILLTCLPAAAQGPQPSARKAWLRPENQTHSMAGGSSAGGVVAKAFFLIAAIGGGGYVLWRRSRRGGEAQPLKRAHVRVLSGTQIGPKARAVVADVGGRLILLGVTEHSVRRLAWLESVAEDPTDSEKPGSMRSDDDVQAARVAINAASRDKDEAPFRNQRSSKFSEVLRDAVGIGSKRNQEPAVLLAQTTRDHVAIHAATEQVFKEAQYVDVEGQAAGLVARLNRRS